MNETERRFESSTSIWNYPGVLKIVEEILNIYIIVSLVVVGLETHAYYLFLVAMFGFILTAIFLVISLLESLTRMPSSYYWVESAYGLVAGLSLIVSSTSLLITLRKEFILTCAVGYFNTCVYIADALNKYRLAVTPREKMYWSRPVRHLQEFNCVDR